MDAVGFAGELDEARRAGRTLDALLSSRGLASLGDAYAVQRALTRRRIERGETVIGWKLGYTSIAMRAQMGIDEPNYGPVTDAMLLADGAPVPPGALQPRVEPEIAVRLSRPVPPGSTELDVLACVESAWACLEVVDSVWTGYRFTLLDNTADGSSAGWVVLGDQVPPGGLERLDVRVLVDGQQVGAATGAAAGGHPARGVAWLADQLAADPRGLRAGDVIITGGLTAAHPLDPATGVAAEFGTASRSGSVIATVRTRRGPS